MNGVEGVLAGVLAGHRYEADDRFSYGGRWGCACGAHGMQATTTHVAAEQVKALREWAQQAETVEAAAIGGHLVFCGCEDGPDPNDVEAARAVLTAIFGSDA